MFPSKSNRSNFFLAYFCPFSIIFLSLLGPAKTMRYA